MEPPHVHFVAAGDGDGRDEELPEPPNRPERWQLIGIAVALVVLAGLAVRVLASAPDNPPRPPAAVTPSTNLDSGPTGDVRLEPPPVFPIPIDPSDVHLFPVGCNQTGRTCLLDTDIPEPFRRAVRDRFGTIATLRASMTRAARPVGLRLIVLYFFGREGVRDVSISVRPHRGKKPDDAGVRRSGGGLDVHAETYRGGYRVQVDVLAPRGRVPSVRKVAGLARDPRLRP